VSQKSVAFFGSVIAGGTPRGALRLFRALADELVQRDDIELICLGEPAFDPADPVGCIYECWDGREFLAALKGGEFSAVQFEGSSAGGILNRPAMRSRRQRWMERLMGRYRRTLPLPIRVLLSGLTRKLRPMLLGTSRSSKPGAWRPPNAKTGWAEFPETLFTVASRKGQSFSNRDVTGQVVSLEKVDVLLDFWWFHSPHGNPLAGRYRPPNLRVVAWFLDAIPLRVAHWQAGMIPVPEFRAGVQAHLNAADEVVAISRSAADDVGAFFPHIRKPIHVVPCGLFDADFEAPEGADYINRKLGLDPERMLFTIIGFQEPSKNVPNALRALLKVARLTGDEVQVVIIGFGSASDLEAMLGPVSAALAGSVRVIVVGMVSEDAKKAILSRSTALVYPSKWEGFGIPPLEAMAAGTQVVAGDIPPLREVCIDLAEYCDPYDVDSIADAVMQTLSKSPAELVRYVERAREHARRYTWAAAAARLHASVIAPGATLGSRADTCPELSHTVR
jgi:glycosyltransferase involved in cell wall biosynthesis